MTAADYDDDLEDDEAAPPPIVQWFDDPFWRVQFVPTTTAFLAGALFGAAAAIVAVRLLDSDD